MGNKLLKSAIAVENSENIKLGLVSATYVSQHTCPTTCPLRNAGCYAQKGNTGIHTARLNRSKNKSPLTIAKEEALAINSLTGKKHLRLHVVGDCKDIASAKILAESADNYMSKHGKIVWAYTHTKRIPKDSWGKISVLRSVHTVRQAETAHKQGYASALVVDAFKDTKKYSIGRGLNGIPCPQQTGKAKDCVSCGLCMKSDKLHKNNIVILFKKH